MQIRIIYKDYFYKVNAHLLKLNTKTEIIIREKCIKIDIMEKANSQVKLASKKEYLKMVGLSMELLDFQTALYFQDLYKMEKEQEKET